MEYNNGLDCIKVKLPVPLDRYLRYYYYNSPLALALYTTHFLLTFFVRSFYRVSREGVFFWFLFRFSFFLFSLSLLSRAFLTYVLWIHNTEFELGKIDNRWRRRRCDLIFFSSPFRMVDSVDPLFGWGWVDRFSEVSKKTHTFCMNEPKAGEKKKEMRKKKRKILHLVSRSRYSHTSPAPHPDQQCAVGSSST